MHQASEYSGALFQVASQFNALEMTGFEVTPEHGVTRYMHDRTQGPACAIAAARRRSTAIILCRSPVESVKQRNAS